MKVNGLIFLKFNDFHIPFSDSDLFMIELQKQAGNKLIKRDSYSAGISVIEDPEMLEELNNYMVRAEDETTAPFNRQTLVMAPEDETFSGEIIQQAIEESNLTKQPLGKVIQKLVKNAKVITQITPGEGVPEMTKRSGKK
jgi:hypothetical protein